MTITLDPGNSTQVVGCSLQFTSVRHETGCDGFDVSFNDGAGLYEWLSSLPGIASINNQGVAACLGIGSTTISASGTFLVYTGLIGDDVSSDCSQCQAAEQQAEDEAPVDVDPTVQISQKDFVFVGNDQSVTAKNLFFASAEPPGGQLSWSVSGTGLSIAVVDANSARVTAASASSSLLDSGVTVGYTHSGESATPASRSITKRLFKFLQQSGQIQVIALNGPEVFGYDSNVF